MTVIHDLKNVGNCRSSSIGPREIVPTEKGLFVRYNNYPEAWLDAANRLTSLDFPYAQEGRKTIEQIIERWAPSKDGNDTTRYVSNVVSFMNEWIESEGSSTPMAPKPNIKWVGSPNHYNGRGGKSVIAIVDHIMQGTMASTRGWFNNQASQVSSTFGVGKDGSIEQYVDLANAAWANGIAENIDTSIPWLVDAVRNNINENNLTVSIEHEGNTGDVMPEAQYQSTLALHRWLISLYNIPVDRKHIIGHYQISGHIKANCPGTGFPWSRLMADLTNGGATVLNTNDHTPLPKPAVNTVNGKTLGGGFKLFYDKLAAVSPNFELLVLGLPLTNEFDCDLNGDGKGNTIQIYERGILVYEAANFSPWDVHLGTIRQVEIAVQAAKSKALIV